MKGGKYGEFTYCCQRRASVIDDVLLRLAYSAFYTRSLPECGHQPLMSHNQASGFFIGLWTDGIIIYDSVEIMGVVSLNLSTEG